MNIESLSAVLTPTTLKALVGLAIVAFVLIALQCYVNHRVIKLMQLMHKTSKLGTLYRRHLNTVTSDVEKDMSVVQTAFYQLCHDFENDPETAEQFVNAINAELSKMSVGSKIDLTIIGDVYSSVYDTPRSPHSHILPILAGDFDGDVLSEKDIRTHRRMTMNKTLEDIGVHTKELETMVKRFKRLKPAHAEIIMTTINEANQYIYSKEASMLGEVTLKHKVELHIKDIDTLHVGGLPNNGEEKHAVLPVEVYINEENKEPFYKGTAPLHGDLTCVDGKYEFTDWRKDFIVDKSVKTPSCSLDDLWERYETKPDNKPQANEQAVIKPYATIKEYYDATEAMLCHRIKNTVKDRLFPAAPEIPVQKRTVIRDNVKYSNDENEDLYVPLAITSRDTYFTKGSYSYVYTKEGYFTVITPDGLKVINKEHKIAELHTAMETFKCGNFQSPMVDTLTQTFNTKDCPEVQTPTVVYPDVTTKEQIAKSCEIIDSVGANIAPDIARMDEYVPEDGRFEKAPDPEPIDPDAPEITSITEQ